MPVYCIALHCFFQKEIEINIIRWGYSEIVHYFLIVILVIAKILNSIKFSLRKFFLKCSVLFGPVVDLVTLIICMLMDCLLVK